MASPRIGYTFKNRNREYFLKWRTSYWYALAMAGGEPVPIYPDDDLNALCPTLDGVLLTGGGDVHPRFFGQEIAGTQMDSVNEALDELELTIARRAAAAGKPLLGICRGIQVINIALGGGLIQHIEGHAQVANTFDGPPTQHVVHIEPDSLLARTLANGSAALVNTYHHQAVPEDDLAPGLRVTARAEDGVVEALELAGHPFYLGVQWHPERLYELGAEQRNLFRALIAAAAERRTKA
jgi:putative glutamine amidotransferase